MLQLIPGADEASTTESMFLLERMKAAWRPTPTHLRTRSFPTPYAQAEMMAHVLGLLELIPGAKQPRPELDNPRLEQTFERWRLLLLGVVTGLLEIESVDLRAPAARKFGAMLTRLRPDAPFLPVLRAMDVGGIQGRKLVVGAGDPNCLFWCSPRLGSFIDHAGTFWNTLKGRIDTNPDLPSAMRVLADWRESLRANGYWNPAGVNSPPWMKALEVLLAGTRDSGGELMARDARFVGPIKIAVPSKTTAGVEELVVYLPVYHRGWAERFAELLFFQPIAREREQGIVDLVDPVGREIAAVAVAPVHAAPGLELFAGVGQIREKEGVARIHGASYWLDDQPGGRGYRSLIFDPLVAAAARSHRRVKLEERQILANPILFPDSLRLLAQRPAVEDGGGVRVTLSRTVTARLKSGEQAPRTGVPVSQWDPEQPLPRVLAIPAPAGRVSVALVESYGPADKPVDVGEIRALGFTLWLCFLREAELRPDGARIVWSAAEEEELLGRSLVHGIESPLEVYRDALASVHGESERKRARDRMASLQRFKRAWRARGDGDPNDPATQGERVGRIAAETFLEWVLGGRDRLGDFGPRSAKEIARYVLHDDVQIPLLGDGYTGSGVVGYSGGGAAG